jgi:hypothetical protein
LAACPIVFEEVRHWLSFRLGSAIVQANVTFTLSYALDRRATPLCSTLS